MCYVLLHHWKNECACLKRNKSVQFKMFFDLNVKKIENTRFFQHFFAFSPRHIDVDAITSWVAFKYSEYVLVRVHCNGATSLVITFFDRSIFFMCIGHFVFGIISYKLCQFLIYCLFLCAPILCAVCVCFLLSFIASSSVHGSFLRGSF